MAEGPSTLLDGLRSIESGPKRFASIRWVFRRRFRSWILKENAPAGRSRSAIRGTATFQFFDAMLKTISSAITSINANRVYTTGHSNGGYFTYVLWAARGDKLAAVAPIASTHDQFDFKLMKPKPILHIAGEDRIPSSNFVVSNRRWR